MGLDISVFTKCKKTADSSAEQNTFHAFCLRDCSPNVADPGTYTYETGTRKWGGPYSHYGLLRSLLCKLATGKDIGTIWANPKPALPFIELLNTSDCEGSFDTATCRALSEDFATCQPEADKITSPDFKHFYTSFREAFTIAAENEGFVYFG